MKRDLHHLLDPKYRAPSIMRLVCLLLGHRPWRKVDPKTCMVFWCERCCRTVPGGRAVRR